MSIVYSQNHLADSKMQDIGIRHSGCRQSSTFATSAC